MKMSEMDDLKRMIMSFRVSELQMLLTFAGSSKMGRKSELQSRAIRLLERAQNNVVALKIRELFRMIGPNANPGMAPIPQSLSMQKPGVCPSYPDANRNLTSMGNYTNTGSHYNSQSNFTGKPVSNFPFPVHPDIKFKKLAFYDVLDELVKPSTLIPATNYNKNPEMQCTFKLKAQQATDIGYGRDLRPFAKIQYAVQVQLRFCLADASSDLEDKFPSQICVKVNDKLVPLPNPLPVPKPGLEPRRPPRPLNITPQVKISPTVTNKISVSWNPEYGKNYCLAVYLVRKLTSTDLLERLKEKGARSSELTKAMIKEKVSGDADSEISTMYLRVSLACPLGKSLMQVPCRAGTCNHLQCFDVSLYLQMNERRSTWVCPVCDRTALYDDLFIDGYFMDVLNNLPANEECTEIQVDGDGSWVPLAPKKKDSSADKSTTVVQTLNDDDCCISSPSPVPEESLPAPAVEASSDKSEKPSSIEIIDLLSDSDEEAVSTNVSRMNNTQRDINVPSVTKVSSALTPAVADVMSNSVPTYRSTPAVTNSGRSACPPDSPTLITIDSPSPPPLPPLPPPPTHLNQINFQSRSNSSVPPHSTPYNPKLHPPPISVPSNSGGTNRYPFMNYNHY